MTTAKLFGTDGIRGVAGKPPMDAETLCALAHTLAQQLLHERPACVVLGRDTRDSGTELEAALSKGLIAEGVHVLHAGILPTPALPVLIRHYRAALGIMLTASHNPWCDNGVKIFTAEGTKLSDSAEKQITIHLNQTVPSRDCTPGTMRDGDDAEAIYAAHLRDTLPKGFHLRGRKIVLDCAHGAAYRIAPKIFAALEPEELRVLHTTPNGRNINHHCGATDVAALQEAVRDRQADIGLAFDGDADRLIAVDEYARKLDGDQIMAAIVHHWKITEGFSGDLVCTVMSNMGLDRFLVGMGGTIHRTPVGDRHVVARMRELAARFGGEQSGHMIFRENDYSGDGLFSALKLLGVLQAQEIPASRIATTFEPLVQRTSNVPCTSRMLDFAAITAAAEAKIGAEGCVLVRLSGTEPLVRITVQDEDRAQVDAAIEVARRMIEADETALLAG